MSLFVPGEVVYVVSNQAAGYQSRNKYHLCVCGHQGIYLFINSRSWSGSFPLPRAVFPALPNEESHIACNTVLKVPDAYMRANGAVSIGHLSKGTIAHLIDHVNDCDVMTEEEKEQVISGLTAAIS